MLLKSIICVLLIVVYGFLTHYIVQDTQVSKEERAMHQLDDGKSGVQARQTVRLSHLIDNNVYIIGWGAVGLFCFLLFLPDVKRMFINLHKFMFCFIIGLILISNTGCRKPFEPVNLETIQSNEEAFLIPLTGDAKKQNSSNNEDYLKGNMVFAQQVQIPQQWVDKGYGWYNGEWRDAAILIKVNTSPITCEWTADPMTGTSNKNEAIWVMTSDQVEFSTGWTITSRIGNKDDAVKFLHNYRNDTLKHVMDSEVRGKLQAEFGLEVTDLPMDKLRKDATPHITKVVSKVTNFFKERGITITNLGISGGFVYKDKSVIDTLVKVFNAEQEKNIAQANTNAQLERNKAVILKATGEADAILKTRKAEADGIKMLIEARNYELQKAKESTEIYTQLKLLELQKTLLERWDGRFPQYFMGSAGNTPSMLLQVPTIGKQDKK